MKKVFLIGALALGMMSFNSLDPSFSEICADFAESVESEYALEGCNSDVYNMAYNMCMSSWYFPR